MVLSVGRRIESKTENIFVFFSNIARPHTHIYIYLYIQLPCFPYEIGCGNVNIRNLRINKQQQQKWLNINYAPAHGCSYSIDVTHIQIELTHEYIFCIRTEYFYFYVRRCVCARKATRNHCQ